MIIALSQIRRVATPGLLFIGVLLVSNSGASVAAENRQELQGLRQFSANYEPSGAQQLADGRIVIVEDESSHALSVLTISDDGEMLPKSLTPMLAKSKLGKLNDLEGVTADNEGYIYAITSHSPKASGKRTDAREKLVRFKLDGEKITEPDVIDNLREAVSSKHSALKSATQVADVKDDNGFSIEGLSFDKTKEELLIGLRSPVINDKAVIVAMQNLGTAFAKKEKPQIVSDLIYLDLDKGGIRGMTYDDKLDGYLILSRREDKKKKLFRLWFWDGDRSHSPRHVQIQGDNDIKHAEGITPIRHNGRERLLIVFDDGSVSKDKLAHYLLLTYEQLQIEPPSSDTLAR